MTLQGPGPVVSGASIQELLSTASGGIAARHSQAGLSVLSALLPAATRALLHLISVSRYWVYDAF